jgi:hypothetical protein
VKKNFELNGQTMGIKKAMTPKIAARDFGISRQGARLR